MLKLAVLLIALLSTSGPQRSTAPSIATRPAWPPQAEAALQTVAERSGFKATSRHGEVVELMDRLAGRSKQARRLTLGTTVEGREIPVIVFADPPVATPEEARQAREQGKLVVLLFGNIHAGEVDAKEALLMLARELATTPDHPLLKDLVVAIAPIYNADGNERFGPIAQHRPGQAGPDEGAGQRHNAQDLDLNRDFVKLEAPETRALVKFMRQWDPAIVVDGHTTNGSLHRFLMSYAGPKVPAGDAQVIRYSYEKLLPGLTAALKLRTGIDTFFYGNFEEQHTKWTTFPAQPRYGTNYIGLRNRLGLLSESYAYASYEDRIRGTLEFMREVLTYAQDNHAAIHGLLRAADERTAGGPSAGEIALRAEAAPLDNKRTALGFVERQVEGQPRPVAGEPREYEVDVIDKWQPTLSVARPYAYLFPAALKDVVENLQRHGVRVEELREDIELDVTAYTIDSVNHADRAFQGHRLTSVDAVTATRRTRRVEAGTILVRTAQPLGSLAAYLLEPQSEDGLVAWNFFDAALKPGETFPVVRLEQHMTLLTTTVRPPADERTIGKRITYETLYGSDNAPSAGRVRQAGQRGRGRAGGGGGRPDFDGSPIGGLRWIDEDHYLQFNGNGLSRVNATTGRSERFHDVEAMASALKTLPKFDERGAQQFAAGGRFNFSKDFSSALIAHANDLYVYNFDEKKAVRLTESPQAEELYEFSPDGRFVAFVRENDLYVVDVKTQRERALTSGGTDTLRNGKADWVYFEELFGRNWKAYWWSPDSLHIAFLQTDASKVDTYTLTDDLADPIGVEVARYPKAGTPNPIVKLGIVSAVADEEVQWADLKQYPPDDLLIAGVGWWPDSSVAYFFAQNREQTWLDLCTVGRSGGEPTRLLRDETEAWVEPAGGPWVLEDGSFLLMSDRSGWRHIYRFKKNGELDGPLTTGEWDVRGVEQVDEKSGWIYFNATKDSPIAQNLYRARLDGSRLTRLTVAPGSHSVTLSPAGTRYVDSWSNRSQPTQVALFAADGTRQRTLDTNPAYAIEEYVWGEDEQFQIPTADGFPMEASWVKPPDFDPSRKYPVWITTYAGPSAPSVRDSWDGGRTWDQMLAGEGIVVVRVDPRSASGKGAKSAWTAYRQLGVQETKDLEDAVRWLTKHEWVDGSRIGLSGHSYGGYMTAYALTHSKLFSAGIAGAPVTDWHDYDTIYTERYMGTPQSNSEGYDKSSAVKAAADLHGELLLIHGAIDDNVHPQNTLRLAKALQDAGKPFEMMIYPGMRHGIFGRHYNRLTIDFIRRTMGVEAERATDTSSSGAPTAEIPERGGEQRTGAMNGAQRAAPTTSGSRRP